VCVVVNVLPVQCIQEALASIAGPNIDGKLKVGPYTTAVVSWVSDGNNAR
jgi:hypothetical protein